MTLRTWVVAALVLSPSVARAEVLTLADALARARAHPRLTQARATARAAAAQIDEAQGGWLPSASVTAGAALGTANFSPLPGISFSDELRTTTAYRYLGATASLSQTIWDFGRTPAQVAGARAAARAADRDVEVTRADVDLGVRLAYYDVLAAVELDRVAAEAVTTMERHLAAAVALVRVGKRPPFDVTKARIDLANARVAKMDAAAALDHARLTLAAAMGADSLELAATLAVPPVAAIEDPGYDQVVARALSRRPEVANLEARLVAARTAVRARRSAFWPVLSALGQGSVRGVDRNDFAPATNWQLGVQLNVPVLAGGADLARLRQQEDTLRALEASRATVILQLKVEAQQLVNEVASARARQEAARTIAASAHENLGVAEERYGAGLATIIELADAQQTLTSALAQDARARYRLAAARARRDRAAGTP